MNSDSLSASSLVLNYATSAVPAADCDVMADSATLQGSVGSQASAPTPGRLVYVGTGGTLTFSCSLRPSVVSTMYNIPDGTFIPIKVTKIYQTTTTCQKIAVFL